MATLQEHLEQSYDVDVEQQIALRIIEGSEPLDPMPAAAQRFIVDDEAKAEWALRKLARAEAEMARDRALATEEIAKISSWLEERSAVILRRIEFFSSLLVEFHTNEIAADPNRKTISLPSGTLRARKAADRWVIEAPEVFITWAKDNLPEAVRVKESPALAEIKSQLAVSKVACTTEDGQPGFYASVPDTGEIVPGVTVVPVPGGLTYSVQAGDES